MAKSPDAFRTISEVAEWLDVPTHVLRFWESRFTQVKPVKRAGGRRYYRPADMELLGGIKQLLHEDGLTIRGVQKLLREEGVRHVSALSPPLDSDPATRESAANNVVQIKRAGSPPPDPDAALKRWPFVDDGEDTATADAEPKPDTPQEQFDFDRAAEQSARSEREANSGDPAQSASEMTEVATETSQTPDESSQDDPVSPQVDHPEPAGAEVAPEAQEAAAEASQDATTLDQVSASPPENDRSEVAGSEGDDAQIARPPLPQPEPLDESRINGSGIAALAGLATLSRERIMRHHDTLEHALDRAQGLKRAMDRADA